MAPIVLSALYLPTPKFIINSLAFLVFRSSTLFLSFSQFISPFTLDARSLKPVFPLLRVQLSVMWCRLRTFGCVKITDKFGVAVPP